ncbi:MAG: hypothetical protein IJ559_02795 [Prevotella sp.]|nr:hypothetical protein [Prevotella sp.]
MRKRILYVCLAAAALLAMPQTMSAQGLFGKISKGLDKVNKALENTNDKLDVASGQAVELPGGGMMYNPASQWLDIQLVGVYGVSTSNNYGYVEVVMKVNMKLNKSSVSFGGKKSNLSTQATDTDGNIYKMKTNIYHSFDVEEGEFVKVTLNDGAEFVDVRKSATVFQTLKLFCHADYEGHEALITFKNVPVQWDVEH